jgi:hypothetical protein
MDQTGHTHGDRLHLKGPGEYSKLQILVGWHTQTDTSGPWRDIKVGVRCTASVAKIMGSMLLSDKIHSERYNGQNLATFSDNLSDRNKKYEFFQQHGASAHSACNSMASIWYRFWDQIISHPFWPAPSSDWTSCVGISETKFIKTTYTRQSWRNYHARTIGNL